MASQGKPGKSRQFARCGSEAGIYQGAYEYGHGSGLLGLKLCFHLNETFLVLVGECCCNEPAEGAICLELLSDAQGQVTAAQGTCAIVIERSCQT